MNALHLLKKRPSKGRWNPISSKLQSERALKTREELFTQLKTELDIHANIEETIFYPVLEKLRNRGTSLSKHLRSIALLSNSLLN